MLLYLIGLWLSAFYKKLKKMDALSSGKINPAQRDQLMDQVKQQIIIANTQELLTVSIILFGCFYFISSKIMKN